MPKPGQYSTANKNTMKTWEKDTDKEKEKLLFCFLSKGGSTFFILHVTPQIM